MKKDVKNLKLKLYLSNSQNKEKITQKLKKMIKNAIEATLIFENINCLVEVSVTFTDNENIKKLNMQYRNVDSATDVLSFPLNDFGEELQESRDEKQGDEIYAAATENQSTNYSLPIMLGDIVLSLEKAHEQADIYGHGFEREVSFLCVHSTLHLLGYDHETGEEDETDMRYRQRRVMDILGLTIKGDVK